MKKQSPGAVGPAHWPSRAGTRRGGKATRGLRGAGALSPVPLGTRPSRRWLPTPREVIVFSVSSLSSKIKLPGFYRPFLPSFPLRRCPGGTLSTTSPASASFSTMTLSTVPSCELRWEASCSSPPARTGDNRYEKRFRIYWQNWREYVQSS